MLTSKQILDIKKKYGPVFSAEIKGQEVLFRELTFSEFDEIADLQDLEDGSSVDSEDAIIATAVVYPEDFDIDRLPAGLVSSLARQILDVSVAQSRLNKSLKKKEQTQSKLEA